MIVESDRYMLVQLVRKSFCKSNVYTIYNFVLMSHLEYISAHNLPSGSASAHPALKHLQSPSLPVAFLFFLYQHVE